MTENLTGFVQSLQNIIDGSYMDEDGEYMCDVCSKLRGNEELRDSYIHNVQRQVFDVLGAEAFRQLTQSIIKTGATCTTRPEYCSKFKNNK